MDSKRHRFWRWLTWPVLILLAFNLENWASRNGYGGFLTDRIDPESGLGVTIEMLSDPLLSFMLTFLAGGIFMAWADYWVNRMTGRLGPPPRWMLKMQAESASDMLLENKFSVPLRRRQVQITNRYLRRAGMAFWPVDRVFEAPENSARYGMYLSAIAKRVDPVTAAAVNLEGANPTPRLPASTAKRTQQ